MGTGPLPGDCRIRLRRRGACWAAEQSNPPLMQPLYAGKFFSFFFGYLRLFTAVYRGGGGGGFSEVLFRVCEMGSDRE